MKFIPEKEIDDQKNAIREEYDRVFAKILASKKGSPEHLDLLKELSRLDKNDNLFMRRNSFYFSRKRKHIFDEMERRTVFGDRPEFEKDTQTMICEECGDEFLHIIRTSRSKNMRRLCDLCWYKSIRKQLTNVAT